MWTEVKSTDPKDGPNVYIRTYPDGRKVKIVKLDMVTESNKARKEGGE